MSDNLLQLITVLLTTGTISLFWKDIKTFFCWIARGRKTKKFEDYFKNTVAVQKILKEIVKHGADRVMIFRAHNGGSMPQLGKRLYSSLAFCDYDPIVFPDGIHDLQNYILEPSYIANLLKLMREDSISFETSSMTEKQLKEIYQYEGIKFSKLYKLCTVGDSFYYMSVSTKRDQNFTEVEDAGFNYAAGALKSLLIG